MNEIRELKYIPISELYPHPDNPRKDLGDLTELADSIKSRGVMQNLTVVPGHFMTENEFIEMAKAEGVGKFDAKSMYKNEVPFVATGWTIIIGHRRCAAAQLAGKSELPCVVANLTPSEQIATMVSENLQRADLTVIEQAEGFQMMLDLGEDFKSISEQTGFSQNTVRRRVNLLKFDRKKLNNSLNRGGTLEDYEKLNTIKDEKLRNQVLDKVGTSSFNWALESAKRDEKSAAEMKKLKDKLESVATEITDAGNKIYVTPIWSEEDINKLDFENNKLYYKDEKSFLRIYRDKTEKDEEKEIKESKEKAKKEKRLCELGELAEKAYKLRIDFLKSASFKGTEDIVLKFASFIMLEKEGYTYADREQIYDLLGVEVENGTSLFDMLFSADSLVSPLRATAYAAYASMDDSEKNNYSDREGCYNRNKNLDVIYNFLHSLGYVESEEERMWRNGTHRVYPKKKGR